MLVSDEIRDAVKEYSAHTGLKMHAITEQALRAFLPKPELRKKKVLTLASIEEDLGNDVYRAALWFERAEGAGLIHGNGHHMAQELAEEAVKRLRERAKGSQFLKRPKRENGK